MNCIVLTHKNIHTIVPWNKAMNYVHDASGIVHPEDYLWELIDGVYYPVTK